MFAHFLPRSTFSPGCAMCARAEAGHVCWCVLRFIGTNKTPTTTTAVAQCVWFPITTSLKEVPSTDWFVWPYLERIGIASGSLEGKVGTDKNVTFWHDFFYFFNILGKRDSDLINLTEHKKTSTNLSTQCLEVIQKHLQLVLGFLTGKVMFCHVMTLEKGNSLFSFLRWWWRPNFFSSNYSPSSKSALSCAKCKWHSVNLGESRETIRMMNALRWWRRRESRLILTVKNRSRWQKQRFSHKWLWEV